MSTLGEINSSRALGQPVRLFLFTGTAFGPYAYCDGETAITRSGVVYQPWPIEASDFTFDGTLDKSDVTITMASGSGIEDEYLGFPPDSIVNLTMFDGHMNLDVSEFRAVWRGRVMSPEFPDDEATVKFSAVPISALIAKPGLREHYQLSCRHSLYGHKCRADKPAATVSATVTAIAQYQFTLSSPIANPADFRAGLALWTYGTSRSSLRTILDVSEDGLVVTVRGTLRGLETGSSVSLTKGCNRTEENCSRIHGNILNFGGQPFIPLENPLSSKSQFS